MKTARLICILAAVFLFCAQAWSHPPYERKSGTFQRNDGIKVDIFRCYVDGIIFSDPVSIHFRHQSGELIAKTDFVRDAAIVTRDSGVEVYSFESIWLPFAVNISKFNGSSLEELESTSRFFISPFLHMGNHWKEYLFVLGCVFVFQWSVKAIRKTGKRSILKTLKSIGLVCLQIVIVLILLAELQAGYVSPIIIALLWLVLSPLAHRFKPTLSKTLPQREISPQT